MERRIKEYLELVDDPLKISCSMVVDYLRHRYTDYSRQKVNPFTKMVDKVYGEIVRSELVQASVNMEIIEENQGHNISNNSMRDLYGSVTLKSDIKPTGSTNKRTSNMNTSMKKSKKPKIVARGIDELPDLCFDDIGGLESQIRMLRQITEPAMLHPELYRHLGITPPTGILLYGSPGTGKTLLAQTLGCELSRLSDGKVKFLRIAGPEVVSGMSGESESKLRSLFKEAVDSAPCLLFIDEIDAITGKRENASKDMEKRIVAQFLSSMDEISNQESSVILIGATNRPDSIDPSLRRAGRFDREISVGIPGDESRECILKVLCSKMKLGDDIDFLELARRTPGYVGADLTALTKEAAGFAVNRVYGYLCEQSSGREFSDEDMKQVAVKSGDFYQALEVVQPASKREGFSTIPDVSWDQVGALDTLRHELHMSIVLPISSPELYERLGLKSAVGVCLFGPPGCGKTLLAKAVSNESRASFISVKGPELLSKYVGDSEKAVRQVFQRARDSAPCIIFFDELDALCPRRGTGKSDSVSERVVNQLLTEMDGLDSRSKVYVVAATNRPDIIDPAMLRPGRLDKLLYVPLPTTDDRIAILETHTRANQTPLADDVQLDTIGKDPRCNGFSGADCASLVREASTIALETAMNNSTDFYDNLLVDQRHFLQALSRTHPSVSEGQRRKYDKMNATLCFSRSAINDTTPELL